jgi:hypothetical protein
LVEFVSDKKDLKKQIAEYLLKRDVEIKVGNETFNSKRLANELSRDTELAKKFLKQYYGNVF